MDEPQPESVDAAFPIRSEGRGFAVEGPGFYAWDEDVERVRQAARELGRGRAPREATRRLLRIEPQGAALDVAPRQEADARFGRRAERAREARPR